MHNNIRIHLFISGRVQGVFFRSNSCEKAVSLGLRGFVKNLDDGRVEIVAEGEKENIGELVEFCKKGSLIAKVGDLEIRYEKVKDEFKEFKIEY